MVSPKNVLGISAIVYVNLTAMEWMVHKYVMHGYERHNFPIIGRVIENESQQHWAHHHEVNSDMTLDIDQKEHRHQGLFFQYKATIFFTGVLYALLTLQFKAFQLEVSPAITAAICVTCTLVYSFLWNNFHALLHGADDVFLSYRNGVPNTYQNTVVDWFPKMWFDWMMYNHAQHHAVKGKSKGNYNIILPGFDYIMQTYNQPPCFDNTTFCENSDLGSCDRPKGCFTVDGRKLKTNFS